MAKKLKNSITRRKFVGWTSSILGAVALTSIFQSIYSGLLFKPKTTGDKPRISKSKRRLKDKTIWNNENLVLNVKTKIIHFPTVKIFKYHNEISKKNIQIVAFDNWEKELTANRFNKDNSGIILEKLALKELVPGINSKSLHAAKDILSLAFTEKYVVQNRFNWRIYDLLLTTIVLNDSIKFENQGAIFNSIISKVDFRNARVPKKNSWLKSQTDFKNKITYVQKNSNIVLNKLANRAKGFWSV